MTSNFSNRYQGKLSALAASVIAYILAVSPTLAESDHAASAEGTKTGHNYHENVVGVFTGITNAGKREDEPALGLEYERRINESFGIGAVVEYTFGDADLWVAAIPFAYHTGHWKLYVAPGIEDGVHGTEGLLRLGGEYAFELSDSWEIAPQLNVDFVGGENVWVVGVVFSKGF